MKRSVFAYALMVMLLLASCNKPQPIPSPTPTPDPTPESSIVFETGTDVTPVVSDAGGKIYLKFNSTDAWTASVINSKADSWITLDKTQGAAGSATITIDVAKNDSEDERNATVMVSAGTATASIVVTQKQKDAITVTASKNEIEAAGGTFSIEVKANIEFTYEIAESCKSWITYSDTKAMKTSTLTFTVAENTETAKREGSVTIKSALGSEVIKVYQVGVGPAIILTKNDYAVKAEGESIQVEVKSNVDVAVEIPESCSWIKASTTKAMSTNTYWFDIAANSTYESRTGEIRFTNKANNLSEKVTVTQVQKNALVVAQNSYSVSNKGGSIEISVGHNVDFDIKIADSWVTQSTKAYVTDKLVFNVAENGTYDNRETKITFTSKDKTITQEVKVLQSQLNALILSATEKTFSSDGGTFDIEVNHNVDFEVVMPSASWISAVETKALQTTVKKFSVAKSEERDARTAEIVIRSKDGSLSGKVTVTQLQKDAIVVAPATYEAQPAGETISLKLGHNVDYSVSVDSDWITKADTKAYTEETLKFAVARNVTEKTRTGKITFTSADGKIAQTVTVSQNSLPVKHVKSVTKRYSFAANDDLMKIATIKVYYADASNNIVEQTVTGKTWSTSVTVTNVGTKATSNTYWPINNTVGALSFTCNPIVAAINETDVYDIDYAVNVTYVVEYTDGDTQEIAAANIAPEMPEQEAKFIPEEVNAVSLSTTIDNELVIDDLGQVAVEECDFWEEENAGYVAEQPEDQMGEEQVPPTTLPAVELPMEPEPEPEPVIVYPERDYVDLGYSVNGKQALWATCNVGARTEGDFGGLYGWGDASGYHVEAEHAFYPARHPEQVVTDGSCSISGTRADIARAQWGPKWRMPSKAEWEALVQNCTYAKKQVDGNWGYEFTSKVNGNHIFLPAADERYVENLYRDSKDPKSYYGYYWAGEWVATDAQLAYYFFFQPGSDNVYKTCQGNKDRYFGHSVRAIRVEP